MQVVETTSTAATPTRVLVGRDLRLALAGGLLLLALVGIGESVTLPPWLHSLLQSVRLPLGLAYVLYVPGWCLMAALFARDDDLDGIERVGLSLGLSVAWVSVLALILDRLPWGLRLWPILLGELASCVVFAAAALWRRSRLPGAEAYAPQLDWRPRTWWRSLPKLDKRVYLLCAGALCVAGLAAAWIFLVPSPDEFMTEFYILGKEGQAEEYPREALPGEPLTVTMGLHNMEREAHTYDVEIWAIDIWEDRAELVTTAGPYELAREEALEQVVTWSMPWTGQDQQVEFRLFGDAVAPNGAPAPGSTEPYRLLRLWINVKEPAP